VVSEIQIAAAGASKLTESEPISLSDYLPVLWGMFLGGLILNLMPCVFPVIGLKILGFVQQAGSDRKKIMLHGLIFTLGVILSFAVISGILFVARGAAGGEAIGWGYQLQNPWVVLSLMLLMFLFGLNMFGVFEVGTSATSIGGSLQSKQGLSGTFFSGILATVVATPCSAPFLGPAIGVAVTLPAVPFFIAFGAMATGLSAPYLILSIFPKLIDYLPRPGAWMESFKQGMSFLLFATTGYLLWVYAGQIDLDNLLNPIFGLSAIGVAAWIYGRWNLPHRSQRSRITAIILTIAFAAAGLFLAKPPKPSAIEWQTWTPEKAEQIVKEGKPVYIDFTAKWCVTCQANKKYAYSETVIDLAKKKHIVFLKGDKTKPNPEIEAKLKELGRTAIPVNVLMIPGKEPIITPEILTPQILTDLFNEIPEPK
jgi:thiol:disulfide interchange protein DsbD